mgnify:CR=1 FL=1
MELEVFVHGSMCYSYSGTCLMSSFIGGESGNRGRCKGPCRHDYNGTYILSMKDMCNLKYVKTLQGLGIDSLKIEGRMKTALYVATVARTYRKAIDDYFKSEECYKQNIPWYKEEISKCTYRQFSTGFYYGKPTHENQIYDSNTYVNEYIYLGIIDEVNGNVIKTEQRNKFSVGEQIEIMKPDGRNVFVEVLGIKDADGNEMPSAPHPKQELHVTLSEPADKYDLLRRSNKAE